MAVTVYRYDDVGAPALESTANGSLVAVLDACLVNGYGAKSPAGWTKEYTGAAGTDITGMAAYRQGGGCQFYLWVDDDNSTSKAYTAGYESMTAIDAGTNRFPTSVQSPNGVRVTHRNTGLGYRPWVLIADNKRFYLWTGIAYTSAGALSESAAGQGLFFFGDIVSFKPDDAYCCQILGSGSDSVNTETFGASGSLSGVISGHYIARDAAQTALSVPNSKTYDRYAANSSLVIGSATAAAYPDPVSGAVNLSRILLTNGAAAAAVRGRLPGCWASLNALPGNNGDTFSGVGELAGREFILLDCANTTTRGRVAIETSDTWD